MRTFTLGEIKHLDCYVGMPKTSNRVGVTLIFNLLNWYLKALKQYADFQTRSTLREYWMFCLFNCIVMLLMILVGNVFGTKFDTSFYGVFYCLYAILIMIPGLAITVRRLHDIGKSGWMILVSLIPIIGAIWLLSLMVRTGDPEKNQYGPNPNTVIED